MGGSTVVLKICYLILSDKKYIQCVFCVRFVKLIGEVWQFVYSDLEHGFHLHCYLNQGRKSLVVIKNNFVLPVQYFRVQ